MLDLSKKRIVFFDNNFLASIKPHIVSVLLDCYKLNKEIDFNQGLDARLFTEEIAGLFSEVKIRPLRFAFDDMSNDGNVQRAIKLAKSKGIVDISCYVLYNFKDTPEDLFYRISELINLHTDAYPMRFQPLNTKVKDEYVGKNWTKQMITNFNLVVRTYFSNMVIGKGHSVDLSRHKWKVLFKDDATLFRKIITECHEHPELLPRIQKEKEEVETIDWSMEAKVQEKINSFGGLIDRSGAIKLLRDE